MRKAVIALIAVCLGIFGFLGVSQNAEAATNGTHNTFFQCLTGSGSSLTVVNATLNYTVSGIGNSSPNVVHANSFLWNTSPSSLLDQLEISLSSDEPGSGTDIYNRGLQSGADVQNDVEADKSVTTNWSSQDTSFDNDTPGVFTLKITGGTGSSSATCEDFQVVG